MNPNLRNKNLFLNSGFSSFSKKYYEGHNLFHSLAQDMNISFDNSEAAFMLDQIYIKTL